MTACLMEDHRTDMQRDKQRQEDTRPNVNLEEQGDELRIAQQLSNLEDTEYIDRAVHHQHTGHQHGADVQVDQHVPEQRQHVQE